MKILLVKNLKDAKKLKPTITVSADYSNGSVCKGSKLTLSNYGWNNVTPCRYQGRVKVDEEDVIVTSRIDANCVCAISSLLNHNALTDFCFSDTLISSIDSIVTNGASYLLNLASPQQYEVLTLNGVIADNSVPKSEEQVIDITDNIKNILTSFGSLPSTSAGKYAKKYYDTQQKIEDGLVREIDTIRVFNNEVFSNDEFTNPESHRKFNYIVAYNQKLKNIVISKLDEETPGDMLELIQGVFGKEAEGTEMLAESPKGKELVISDLDKVVLALIKLIKMDTFSMIEYQNDMLSTDICQYIKAFVESYGIYELKGNRYAVSMNLDLKEQGFIKNAVLSQEHESEAVYLIDGEGNEFSVVNFSNGTKLELLKHMIETLKKV